MSLMANIALGFVFSVLTTKVDFRAPGVQGLTVYFCFGSVAVSLLFIATQRVLIGRKNDTTELVRQGTKHGLEPHQEVRETYKKYDMKHNHRRGVQLLCSLCVVYIAFLYSRRSEILFVFGAVNLFAAWADPVLHLYVLGRPAVGDLARPFGTVGPFGENSAVRPITDMASLEEAHKAAGGKPVVVQFFAAWCGPCKSIAPWTEALAIQEKEYVDFYAVDIDLDNSPAVNLKISGVPTIMIFKNGEMLDKVVGVNKSRVLGCIEDAKREQ